MPTIDLIYHRDCPHAAQTRTHLRAAFTEVGLAQRRLEWDRADSATPPELRRYGSPTILVNGHDVAGTEPASADSNCRLYGTPSGGLAGVPSIGLISAALRSYHRPPMLMRYPRNQLAPLRARLRRVALRPFERYAAVRIAFLLWHVKIPAALALVLAVDTQDPDGSADREQESYGKEHQRRVKVRHEQSAGSRP